MHALPATSCHPALKVNSLQGYPTPLVQCICLIGTAKWWDQLGAASYLAGALQLSLAVLKASWWRWHKDSYLRWREVRSRGRVVWPAGVCLCSHAGWLGN